MSSRNRRIGIALAFLFVSAGIIFWQFKRFRSVPLIDSSPSSFSVFENHGLKRVVPASEIISAGPLQDGVPAIDAPDFEGVAAADQYLKDEGLGIDVEAAGKHRFYPFQILVWHLAVNDTIGGKPVLMSFCPLCQSGGVYERLMDGVPMQFGTAGKVWNGISVLYDKNTQTRWTADGGLGLEGPQAGKRLRRMPSRVVSWKRWKIAYPDGFVLSRRTGAVRDYTLDPYGPYAVNRDVKFSLVRPDLLLPVKTLVVGVSASGGDVAYEMSDLAHLGVVDDVIGEVPISVWADAEEMSATAYDRRLGTRELTFHLLPDGTIKDKETGSSWRRDGLAATGPLRGKKLMPLPLDRTFWYCWAALHPEGRLYKLP